MFPPYTRDHGWEFVKLKDAEQCYARLQKLLFGAHNHPMPKRRVELWDEKPRLVLSEKGRRFGIKPRIPVGAPELRRKKRRAA